MKLVREDIVWLNIPVGSIVPLKFDYLSLEINYMYK